MIMNDKRTDLKEQEQPNKKKNLEHRFIASLDKVQLLYCIFTSIIVSLLTGASKMGSLAFLIFVIMSSVLLYTLWLVYILLSRILSLIYRKYIRGYLSGIKKAKKDLEEDD